MPSCAFENRGSGEATYILMGYIGMAYIGLAYIGLAYIGLAYIVMALHSHGA